MLKISFYDKLYSVKHSENKINSMKSLTVRGMLKLMAKELFGNEIYWHYFGLKTLLPYAPGQWICTWLAPTDSFGKLITRRGLQLDTNLAMEFIHFPIDAHSVPEFDQSLHLNWYLLDAIYQHVSDRKPELFVPSNVAILLYVLRFLIGRDPENPPEGARNECIQIILKRMMPECSATKRADTLRFFKKLTEIAKQLTLKQLMIVYLLLVTECRFDYETWRFQAFYPRNPQRTVQISVNFDGIQIMDPVIHCKQLSPSVTIGFLHWSEIDKIRVHEATLVIQYSQKQSQSIVSAKLKHSVCSAKVARYLCQSMKQTRRLYLTMCLRQQLQQHNRNDPDNEWLWSDDTMPLHSLLESFRSTVENNAYPI